MMCPQPCPLDSSRHITTGAVTDRVRVGTPHYETYPTSWAGTIVVGIFDQISQVSGEGAHTLRRMSAALRTQ